MDGKWLSMVDADGWPHADFDGASTRAGAGTARAAAGGATAGGRYQGSRREAGSREIQGDDKGADAVWRSPSGDGPQSRGNRLDRSPAEKLRLHQHGPHQIRVPAGASYRRYGPARSR